MEDRMKEVLNAGQKVFILLGKAGGNMKPYRTDYGNDADFEKAVLVRTAWETLQQVLHPRPAIPDLTAEDLMTRTVEELIDLRQTLKGVVRDAEWAHLDDTARVRRNLSMVKKVLALKDMGEVEMCPACEGKGYWVSLGASGGKVTCPQCRGEKVAKP